jgi:hypothetical protein
VQPQSPRDFESRKVAFANKYKINDLGMKKMFDKTHDDSAPPTEASAAGSRIANQTAPSDIGCPPTVPLTERSHSLGTHLILKELFEREAVKRRR